MLRPSPFSSTAIVTLIALLSVTASASFADRRVESVRRAEPNGDGIEQAPTLTVSWDPAVKEGDTILVQAAVTDADGGPVEVSFYVDNVLRLTQANPPYGIFITKEIYGSLPVDIAVHATDDYGNKTRARFVARSMAVASALDCTLVGTDLSVAADGVEPSDSGAAGFTLSYSADNSDNSDSAEATVTVAVSTSGRTATATVSVNEDGAPSTFEMTGTVTLADDGVTVNGVTLSDSEQATTLECVS